jgi:hypothetical protein
VKVRPVSHTGATPSARPDFNFHPETAMRGIMDTVWLCEGKLHRSIVNGYSKPSSSGPYTPGWPALAGAVHCGGKIDK